MVTHWVATIDGGYWAGSGDSTGEDSSAQPCGPAWRRLANQGRLGWRGQAPWLWPREARRWQKKSLKTPGPWRPAPSCPPEPATPPSKKRKQFLEPMSWWEPRVRVLFQTCKKGATSMKFSWRVLPWGVGGISVAEGYLSHTVRAGTCKNGPRES